MYSTERTVLQVGRYSFSAEVLHGYPRVQDQEVAERLGVGVNRIREKVRDLTRRGELQNILAFLVPRSGKTKATPEFWFNASQLERLIPEFEKTPKLLGKSEVYFIRSEQADMIKIGYTTDIAQRLNNLQTASPFSLKLLISVPGTLEDERNLHKLFDSCRGHGEWFAPHPELLEFIDTCREISWSSAKIRLRDLIKQKKAEVC